MASAVLIPSSYYVSSSYLTVSNPENMYDEVASSDSGVVTNTQASTSYYYFYLRGFNISDIPANAVVSDIDIKIRGSTSGGYNASMYLCHGTSTISGATATSLSRTVSTRTFALGSLTWEDIVGYGDTFGIRVNCRRNAKNTQATWTIYGAEIDVTYTVPEPPSQKLYFKDNGAWVEASRAYVKVNGVWVEQQDLSTVFDSNTNYVKG